jgi:ATP adenylyltransferase
VPRKDNIAPTKKPDPFDNPSSDLLIAQIPQPNPSHLLVLNKFPVITEHFILATKANKPQTHLLEEDDLVMTYACLKAWQTRDKQRRLFAFFNSGEHSGASQPHRHLQFLPVESMVHGQQSDGWDLLIDLILSRPDPSETGNSAHTGPDTHSVLLSHPSLPFEHFAYRLPVDPTGDHLTSAYNALYQLARQAVDKYIANKPNTFALHDTSTGSLPISYNLAMATDGMAILPRRAEGEIIRRDDGTEIGFVALNGTALGGTLMVKQQQEWDLLREQPQRLDSILEAIGFPKGR